MVSAEAGGYLVEMLFLKEKFGEITVTKLSERLYVSPPAVSQMVRKLDEEDLVRFESYGKIRLTSRGRNIAKNILAKRRTMRSFLLMLGIKKGTRREAEFLASSVSDRVYESILGFIINSANGIKSVEELFPLSRAEVGEKLVVIAVTARANTTKKLIRSGVISGRDMFVKDVKRSSILVSVGSSEFEIKKKDAKNIFVISF